jgi:hypothetical protein
MDQRHKLTPAFQHAKRLLIVGVKAADVTKELEMIGQPPPLVSGPGRPWDVHLIHRGEANGRRADQ